MVGSIVVADGDHDTHTDDVLSHSPAGVRRAKADAIAGGESTVGAKIRDELGDLLSVLRGVDVLKALSNSDLSTLCDSLLRCMIPAGEIVMRQGERSSTFYLIIRGTATVARSEAPGEPEKFLLHLGRLAYFGERVKQLRKNDPDLVINAIVTTAPVARSRQTSGPGEEHALRRWRSGACPEALTSQLQPPRHSSVTSRAGPPSEPSHSLSYCTSSERPSRRYLASHRRHTHTPT